MKKQIFILVFLVLATFANVNLSYGQAVTGFTPRGIGCADDAVHPIAGKKYVYKASSNQVGDYTFWSTKDMNFISTTALGVTSTNIATKLASTTTTPTGTDLITTSGNYATADATDNVEITWSDAILNGTTAASPTFVAVNQDGTCVNNFKVWSILPIMAFTVDITNILHGATPTTLAYEAPESQCFDQVRSAKFVVGTGMQYDFGTQVLLFEVVAANFTGSWTPTFTLTGLGNGQTAEMIWDYNKTFDSGETGTPVALTSGTVSSKAVLTTETNTSAGVSIFVKVTITNHTYEGIAATPITLAVDGQNAAGNWDIVNNTVTAPTPLTCTVALGPDKADAATQTLDPRPTITPVPVSPDVTAPFVTPNNTTI